MPLHTAILYNNGDNPPDHVKTLDIEEAKIKSSLVLEDVIIKGYRYARGSTTLCQPGYMYLRRVESLQW